MLKTRLIPAAAGYQYPLLIKEPDAFRPSLRKES